MSLPISLHREFSTFAKKQKMSLSALMRESTDLQIRGCQLKSSSIEAELKELRFQISGIANNVNQMTSGLIQTFGTRFPRPLIQIFES